MCALDRIGCDLLLSRPALDLAGVHVELRPVPWALHRSADQHAVRQRSALVRAAILKGGVAILGPPDGDAFVPRVNQLHLVDAERRRGGGQRAARGTFPRLLLPFAGARVPMVDADLIPI